MSAARGVSSGFVALLAAALMAHLFRSSALASLEGSDTKDKMLAKTIGWS